MAVKEDSSQGLPDCDTI